MNALWPLLIPAVAWAVIELGRAVVLGIELWRGR